MGHLGRDPQASTGWHPRYLGEALKCESAKEAEAQHRLFKRLYEKGRHEESPGRIVAPYKDVTGLNLEDLPNVFGSGAKWRPRYGGKAWEGMARDALRLRDAIEEGDWVAAVAICDRVAKLHHNSGPLVDASKPYKWPTDCD